MTNTTGGYGTPSNPNPYPRWVSPHQNSDQNGESVIVRQMREEQLRQDERKAEWNRAREAAAKEELTNKLNEQREFARKLLGTKIKIETIVHITGLSRAAIEDLQRNNGTAEL